MTNYDLDKVRTACLELAGWVQFLGGWKRGEVLRWDEDRSRIDYTISLDDALPLMEKHSIYVGPAFKPASPATAWLAWKYAPDQLKLSEVDAYAPNPALAVCLCALRCVGRDLKEFEV